MFCILLARTSLQKASCFIDPTALSCFFHLFQKSRISIQDANLIPVFSICVIFVSIHKSKVFSSRTSYLKTFLSLLGLTLGTGEASAFFPAALVSGLTSGWSVWTWLSKSSRLSNFTPHSGHLSPATAFSPCVSPGVEAPPPWLGLWPFVPLIWLTIWFAELLCCSTKSLHVCLCAATACV